MVKISQIIIFIGGKVRSRILTLTHRCVLNAHLNANKTRHIKARPRCKTRDANPLTVKVLLSYVMQLELFA